MAPLENSGLWKSTPPVVWPSPPTEMTVTTLAEIEACPRRWALGAAEYPQLWSGRGYPRRAGERAHSGSVVHLVLEKITQRLVRAHCTSAEDPQASVVLRDLGGYTKVVHQCIDEVLERLAHNPRAEWLLESIGRTLRAKAPEIRSQVQGILCRIRLVERVVGQHRQSGPERRVPLTEGAFSEVELRAPQIGWKGRADLLVLSDAACEITDFKTGPPEEGHALQVQVYALLWKIDSELNPKSVSATRLVLAYISKDVEVPAPNSEQLINLERHVVALRDSAHQVLSEQPPPARPSSETCRYCDVRQLCDAYWTPDTQQLLAAPDDSRGFSDVELEVTGRHGSLSWDAVVLVSRTLAARQLVLLRTPRSLNLAAGMRLRVIDAILETSQGDLDTPVIVSMGRSSELYAVA